MGGRKLEAEEVRKWLDEVIESKKRFLSLKKFNENIELGTTESDYEVPLFEGIELIAEALGENLEENCTKNLRWKYYYSFSYKGVRIIQLCENRIEK